MLLIGGSWNSATISALAAILGSLAGPSGSAISTWIAQRHQDRQGILVKRVSHREQLYSEFITESAKLMADAAQHTFGDPSRLIPPYALQPNGILHGGSRITAADPSSTAILGNYRFIYHREPAACRVYPWYNRHLFRGHTASECDARVWSQIESIIGARISPSPVPTQAGIAAQVTSNLRGSAQTEP